MTILSYYSRLALFSNKARATTCVKHTRGAPQRSQKANAND